MRVYQEPISKTDDDDEDIDRLSCWTRKGECFFEK